MFASAPETAETEATSFNEGWLNVFVDGRNSVGHSLRPYSLFRVSTYCSANL
ncbi:MAG: hypothetical protein JWM16_1619 [Verrucomicrobiales bacterium]|nr:hypothetical protein [Verrucomicrobiales bacterium]